MATTDAVECSISPTRSSRGLRAWHLAHLQAPAQLVIPELASNAIQHAGTDLLVTVSRRGIGPYLAVRDGSPVLPWLPPAAVAGAPLREGGRGIRIVQQEAAAWGAVPTDDHAGKVVWAALR